MVIFNMLSDLLQISKKYVSKEISSQIHEKVKPFIEWLKQAEEEESSGEEEEEEEDELVYDNKAEQLSVMVDQDKNKQEEELDDEIDIDDI